MDQGLQSADDDLLVQAAWHYYVSGENQGEVAKRLGISRFKVTRLLGEARDLGIVQVSVRARCSETLRLGKEIAESYGLVQCLVTPPLHVSAAVLDEERARHAVGVLAAQFLARRLGSAAEMTVGLGWGRTVAAMVDCFPIINCQGARFVSLMGSLSRTGRTNPFEVVHRLAAACGAEAYVLPAPFIADSGKDYRVIMSQRLVREALSLGRSAQLLVASFGECSRHSQIGLQGLLDGREIDALMRAGAIGDILGKFFDESGRFISNAANERTPGLSVEDMRAGELVVLAAGLSKLKALRALLASRLVKHLIVDGDLAMALLAGSKTDRARPARRTVHRNEAR